jgi:predicted  nucleic acid-binding Zn-ribbon protein
MPHQCTSCGHVFADGSKEMLGGCPDCGGTKFQFHGSDEGVPDDPPDDSSEPDPDPEVGGVAETVGRATTTVRDWVEDDPEQGAPDPGPDPDSDSDPSGSTGGSDESDDVIVADEQPIGDDGDAPEDHAQASARTDVASPDELPDPPEDRPVDPGEGRVVREPTGDRPDVSQLREELNDQFESIKILEPGQYELNLMELYDREEYIIALQENGRYVIQMPENWIGDEE